ncbi:hypothetical protein GPALN_012169 [Globodera pallida]|nr:hypothetical protein GPALN_012169 [Globodera pallida]
MITTSPNTKKCLAVLQVERKDKATVRLKYAFFMTETEQFFAPGDEHGKPTVGHMTQTLLPKHLAMSMEQLTEKFDLQLQLLDIEFEPAEFIDIDSREWCAERVKDRGTYKVLLHPKLDNRRRLDDEDVPMSEQQRNSDNDWEPIDRFHMSGKAHLGNLYNVLSDNFITSNDLGFMRKKFNMRSLTEQSLPTQGNDIIKIDHLDSLEECIKMLGTEQKDLPNHVPFYMPENRHVFVDSTLSPFIFIDRFATECQRKMVAEKKGGDGYSNDEMFCWFLCVFWHFSSQ